MTEVYQTTVHLCEVVGSLQVGGNLVVNSPRPIKDIVRVHSVAVEPRTFAPLEAGLLAHDTFTGVELFEQHTHTVREIVVASKRYYRRTVHVHIFISKRGDGSAA